MENNLDSSNIPSHPSPQPLPNQGNWMASNVSISQHLGSNSSIPGPIQNHSRTSPLNMPNIMRQPPMCLPLNSQNTPNGPPQNIPPGLLMMGHSSAHRPMDGMIMPQLPGSHHPAMFGAGSGNGPIHPALNHPLLAGMPHPPNFPGFPPYSRYYSLFPFFSLEHRLHDLNKRLQFRPEENDILWWESFASEFFEDDSSLTLIFPMEDGPKQYRIGRILIPRYFRTIFESGCYELYYVLRYVREQIHHQMPQANNQNMNIPGPGGQSNTLGGGGNQSNNPNNQNNNSAVGVGANGPQGTNSSGTSSISAPSLILESDNCDMVMNMNRPMQFCVISEGRLILEFSMEEMRIKNWTFVIRSHRELLLRSFFTVPFQDISLFDQLTKNFTRCGMTPQTLNFLRLSLILEPMQELMSRQKAYSLSPRDCLKTTLFQKWQKMIAPPESNRTTNKRRKRKNNSSGSDNAGGSAGGRGGSSKQKPSPLPQIQNISAAGDVMVVGEPTLMGGNFGDEDERMITRLENVNFPPGSIPHNSNRSQNIDPQPLQPQPSQSAQAQPPPPPQMHTPAPMLQPGNLPPHSLMQNHYPPISSGPMQSMMMMMSAGAGPSGPCPPNSRPMMMMTPQQQQMNHIMNLQQQHQLMMMRNACPAPQNLMHSFPPHLMMGMENANCNSGPPPPSASSAGQYLCLTDSHPSSVKSEQHKDGPNNGFNNRPKSVEESPNIQPSGDLMKSAMRQPGNFPSGFIDSYESKLNMPPRTPSNSAPFSSPPGSRAPLNFN